MAEFRPDYTIGMACFDNFDEVYFTVQALRCYHDDLMDRWEILVVDNNPGSKDGQAVKAFIEGRTKPNGRYVAFDKVKGSVPPRAKMIDEARGKFVVCIDSHVLLAPGCLHGLTDFFDKNPLCDDLLHGPLVSNYGPHRIEGTHMIPRWRSQMFGTWGVDPRGNDPHGEPFDIPQHGLGFFAVRKASWLRFHPDFSGFSGGEGYIHEKYRQAGRRVLCLPFARWYHKFARPHGIPHKPTQEDKIKNHIRGWSELGVDLQTGSRSDPIGSIAAHFVGEKGMKAARFEELARAVGVPYRYKAGAVPIGRVIGPATWGSFKLRGRPIADKFGFQVLNSRSRITLASGEKVGTVLAVKCDIPPVVKAAASRIIFDPLDKWFSDNRQAELSPEEWIAREHKRNGFTDLIAATVPLFDAAKAVLPSSVKVHLIPHQADSRIAPVRVDPSGPVVYAGMSDFVKPGRSSIERACKTIGREFVIDGSSEPWKSFDGASLVLAPRLGVRSKMNVVCKPTIKLANATAAGLPVLATPDEAITSLYFDVKTLPPGEWFDADALAEAMVNAIGSEPSQIRFPWDQWLDRMSRIVQGVE